MVKSMNGIEKRDSLKEHAFTKQPYRAAGSVVDLHFHHWIASKFFLEVKMYRTRQATERVLELVEEGLLDRDTVIMACLKYMSEDDVADMAQANEFFCDEEEYEEEYEKCHWHFHLHHLRALTLLKRW
jgi:hypothetical protein